jgi:hypothetical protein
MVRVGSGESGLGPNRETVVSRLPKSIGSGRPAGLPNEADYPEALSERRLRDVEDIISRIF